MQIDWAIVLSTLLGPILAVWAADWRADRKEERKRREDVFFTLMGTRANRVAPEHVSAINRIDIAFPAHKHAQVTDAWRMYHRHLTDKSLYEQDLAAWGRAGQDHFARLMQAMSADLGIPFSAETVRHTAYYPSSAAQEAQQSKEMRELFVGFLKSAQVLANRSAD